MGREFETRYTHKLGFFLTKKKKKHAQAESDKFVGTKLIQSEGPTSDKEKTSRNEQENGRGAGLNIGLQGQLHV